MKYLKIYLNFCIFNEHSRREADKIFCKQPESKYFALCGPRYKIETITYLYNMRENKYPQNIFLQNSKYNDKDY